MALVRHWQPPDDGQPVSAQQTVSGKTDVLQDGTCDVCGGSCWQVQPMLRSMQTIPGGDEACPHAMMASKSAPVSPLRIMAATEALDHILTR